MTFKCPFHPFPINNNLFTTLATPVRVTHDHSIRFPVTPSSAKIGKYPDLTIQPRIVPERTTITTRKTSDIHVILPTLPTNRTHDHPSIICKLPLIFTQQHFQSIQQHHLPSLYFSITNLGTSMSSNQHHNSVLCPPVFLQFNNNPWPLTVWIALNHPAHFGKITTQFH